MAQLQPCQRDHRDEEECYRALGSTTSWRLERSLVKMQYQVMIKTGGIARWRYVTLPTSDLHRARMQFQTVKRYNAGALLLAANNLFDLAQLTQRLCNLGEVTGTQSCATPYRYTCRHHAAELARLLRRSALGVRARARRRSRRTLSLRAIYLRGDEACLGAAAGKREPGTTRPRMT